MVSTLSAAYPGMSSDPDSRAIVLMVASPDLSRLPYGFYADDTTKNQLRSFTDLLALLFLQSGVVRRQQQQQGEHVKVVDLRGLFDEFEYFASPQQYGFAPLGKYGSCLVGVYGEGTRNGTTECADADERVYWDEYQ